MPRIQYTTTDGASGEFELNQDRISIGRTDDNQLCIADGSVSSHHAEIVNLGGSWVLNDLDSTNGTKAGGERVPSVNLSQTSSFELGSVQCVFIGDGGEPAGPGEAAWSEPQAPARGPTTATGGFSAQPIDKSRRAGFGPHKKEKDPQGSMLMMLGVLGLLAAAAAVFMFTKMGGS